MLHWIEVHPGLLQALSSLVVAVMTLVLILLTSVYARANWKTMRLMEADIRFRTEPIPRVDLEASDVPASAGSSSKGNRAPGEKTLKLRFTTSNAPMVLKDVRLSVSFQSGAHKDFNLPVNGMIRLPVGEEYDLDTEIPATEPVDHWGLNLDYWDLSGRIEYRSWFGPNGGTLSYGPKGSTSLSMSFRYYWHRLRGRDPVGLGGGHAHGEFRHR
jgi:hypothetical protein